MAEKTKLKSRLELIVNFFVFGEVEYCGTDCVFRNYNPHNMCLLFGGLHQESLIGCRRHPGCRKLDAGRVEPEEDN